MAFSHGSKATLTVNAVGLTGYLSDVSMSRDFDTAETSTLGSTDKSYVPGLRDGSFSCSGMVDPAFDAALDAMTGLIVAFVYRPQGAGTGLTEYSGNCILTSYNIKTGVGDMASADVEFQRTGALTRVVQP